MFPQYKIVRYLGVGALFCAPILPILKGHFVVLLMAQDGLMSEIGLEGDILRSWMALIGAWVIAGGLLVLSRLLMGHWNRPVLFFLLGVLVFTIAQDISMIVTAENIEACGSVTCE